MITLPVTGPSMAPFLREGDTVTVVLTTADEVEVGDLVVIERGPLLVLHRAIRREGNTWRTRGDAWSRLDPTGPDERLIARVPGLHLGPLEIPPPFATKTVRHLLVASLPWFARARGLVRRIRNP
jgi:hypothetical protein